MMMMMIIIIIIITMFYYWPAHIFSVSRITYEEVYDYYIWLDMKSTFISKITLHYQLSGPETPLNS
jgi:hypothetical protein